MNYMANPSSYTLDCICTQIPKETCYKLYAHLYATSISTPEKYWLESYIETILNKHFYEDFIDAKEIRNKFHQRKQKNKKNWYKLLKEKVLHSEQNPIEKELQIYGDLKSADDFYDCRLSEINEWANDETSLLTDYRYLNSKHSNQIEQAFENDFIFMIADILKENGYFNINEIKAEESLVNKAESEKDKFFKEILSVKQNEDIYYRDDDSLDETDLKIIKYLLPDHKRFNSYIKVDVCELAGIFLNKADNPTELFFERLRNLTFRSQEIITVDKENRTINRKCMFYVFQEATFDYKNNLAVLMFADKLV